jgi:hypothetical protein
VDDDEISNSPARQVNSDNDVLKGSQLEVGRSVIAIDVFRHVKQEGV